MAHDTQNPEIVIKRLTPDTLPIAIQWAADEGWNPGLADAASFFAADPEGFLLAEIDGEPVGCISAVLYGEAFAFLGLYIVKPAFRGKGIGISLWNAAMDQVAGRNVGLDGVLAQQANYAKSGFGFAHRNIRYELQAPAVGNTGSERGLRSTCQLVSPADVDFASLLSYDERHFFNARPDFLREWINQPRTHAVAALDPEKQIRGYAVIRPCRNGFKVGPLFADHETIAFDLFNACVAKVDAGPVYLDIPEPNRAAGALVESLGMLPMFETARMYTEGDPGLPLPNIYGITSFELG